MEVLLGDRVVTEMSWRSHRIEAVDEAAAQPLEPARIAEFSMRYKRHVIEQRIKGLGSWLRACGCIAKTGG